MTRHTGDRVVENDNGGVGGVVGDVYKTCDARVHKGTVADNSDRLCLGVLAARLVEAVETRNRRAHTENRVDGVERLLCTESVASDVADNGDLVLGEGVEQTSVRASRAHNGGTNGYFFVDRREFLGFKTESVGDGLLRELADGGEELLALDFESESAAMCLDDAVKLLDNYNSLVLCGEVGKELGGQGMGHTDLQYADALAESLADVLIAGARGDDTERASLGVLDAVERSGLCVFCDSGGARLNYGVTELGVAGHHNVFLGVLNVLAEALLDSVGKGDRVLGVCDAGAHTDENGSVEFFGELEGELGEFKRLCRVGGLKHWELGRLGIVTGVLLVLRGVHTGIVGNEDDEAAVYAGVGHGEERVGCHVETDVLHSAGSASAAEGSAEGGLESDLFVGRPFAVDLVVFSGEFCDLGGGSSGVGGNDRASRLVKTAGDGFVSEHKFFHGLYVSLVLEFLS